MEYLLWIALLGMVVSGAVTWYIYKRRLSGLRPVAVRVYREINGVTNVSEATFLFDPRKGLARRQAETHLSAICQPGDTIILDNVRVFTIPQK